jgi:hypothetical protein
VSGGLMDNQTVIYAHQEILRPKLSQEWRDGIKENDGGQGVNSRKIHLIYCKNFCKRHNIPPA